MPAWRADRRLPRRLGPPPVIAVTAPGEAESEQQQMAHRAAAADKLDPAVRRMPALHDDDAPGLSFPVVLGTLALPVRSHPWAKHLDPHMQSAEAAAADAEPPVVPEECRISWEDAGWSGGRWLVLHRPQPASLDPAQPSDEPVARKRRRGAHGASVAAAAADLDEDLELDDGDDGDEGDAKEQQNEVENTGRRAAASASAPRGSNEAEGSKDRRSYSTLKYSKDDEEYMPRVQGWGAEEEGEESSDDELAAEAVARVADRPAAAPPAAAATAAAAAAPQSRGGAAAAAARAPPMTSDGRPLVTRRHKTAADWAAEMDRAVANRGSWRGGRVAFAGGGDSDSEEESDDSEDWGGGGDTNRSLSDGSEEASNDDAAEEAGEEEEEGEENPLYKCVIKAERSHGGAYAMNEPLWDLLRHLYALDSAGWVELSATLRFGTQTEGVRRPPFQEGPRGARGAATRKVQALYLQTGRVAMPGKK
jgi:hypothetical protein